MLGDALAFFLQQIEAAPEQAHWITWYGLADGKHGGPPTLVASLGFFGPPQGGSVELGYSVLPDLQQQGYGAEAAGAITAWALRSGVRPTSRDTSGSRRRRVSRVGARE